MRPGDEDLNVFYVKQGYIRQYALGKDGSEFTLHIYTPRSIFPILETTEKHEYYFESLTPAEVYRIPTDKFQKYMTDNPDTLHEYKNQLQLLSYELLNKLETKIFEDASRQIVASLLDLIGKFGRKQNDKFIIQYWFTHQDIATMTGLSRERVSIEMKKLNQRKLISYNNHLLVVKNLQSLKMELEK